MLSWKRKGCLMTNINVPCISKGASFSNWNKFFTLVTGMWTDQIVFKFRKIIRAPILPVFKPTVLLPDLQTATSSRSLAGSAIAHIWKSWDLTADESRMQSELIKPVWSQVKNSKDKEEVHFSCKHVFGSWFCTSVVLGTKGTIPSLLASGMHLFAGKGMGAVKPSARPSKAHFCKTGKKTRINKHNSVRAEKFKWRCRKWKTLY